MDSVRDPKRQSAHLTNVAVQKANFSRDGTYLRTGGKWELAKMRQYLNRRIGWGMTQELFLKIEGIIVNSLKAVQRVIIADKHCFEL